MKKIKQRRLEAHALSLPQFKRQIVKSKKTYIRKPKHTKQSEGNYCYIQWSSYELYIAVIIWRML